jgi:hypothetical protein
LHHGGQLGHGNAGSAQPGFGAGQQPQQPLDQGRSGGGILHHSNEQHGGGGLNRAEGRAEEDVGKLVGSRALQEKGMQKEQEANMYRQQANELSEAERLEQEAVEARRRAVQHGAHQANAELGAGRGGQF